MTDALTCARTARGAKRRCPSCEQPFYDLKRANVVCPYCGEAVKSPSGRKPDGITGKPPLPRVKWTNAVAPLETVNLKGQPDNSQPDNDE